MKYLIAFSYFAFFCAVLRTFGRLDARTLAYGILMLMAISFFSIFNDSSGLIAEKVASFVSYDMYRYDGFTLTFLIQYALAWIPFYLLDYEYSAHGMNIGIQAFAFMLGARYIFNMKPSWQLLAFSLFPSYFHYSIFGLRDPLINLVAVFVAIGALRLNTRDFVVLCAALSITSIGIRPEFSLIIAGFAGLKIFFDSSKRQRIAIALVGFCLLYAALLVMPLAFGTSSTGSAVGNIEKMIEFNELRNARRIDEYGSGSHILGGALFSYPFPIRYPIQVAASFVAPFPFEIRGTLDLLAFAESLIFCFVFFVAARTAWRNAEARPIFACAMAYMLLQALFAFNYGNVLRVRYPALILFLATTVAPEAMRRFHTHSMVRKRKLATRPSRSPVGVSQPRPVSASPSARLGRRPPELS